MKGGICSSRENRIAVVTGANKGIGLEICRQLASNGIRVILTARDETKAMKALEKLKDSGISDVIFHQLDVTDASSIASLAKFIRIQFGKLDILVNNAAVGGLTVDMDALKASKPADDENAQDTGDLPDWLKPHVVETYEQAENCLQTNYYGTKAVIKGLILLLQSSLSGRIINISSTLGQIRVISNEMLERELSDVDFLTEERLDEVSNLFLKDLEDGLLGANGWPTAPSAYKVSKVLINAYTRILAKNHPTLCINCVNPGFVKTDLNWNSGILNVEEGAKGPVLLALGGHESATGLFFDQTESQQTPLLSTLNSAASLLRSSIWIEAQKLWKSSSSRRTKKSLWLHATQEEKALFRWWTHRPCIPSASPCTAKAVAEVADDYRPWPDIAKPLLEILLARATLLDRVHLSSICHAWREFVAEHPSRRRPRFPWLTPPPHQLSPSQPAPSAAPPRASSTPSPSGARAAGTAAAPSTAGSSSPTPPPRSSSSSTRSPRPASTFLSGGAAPSDTPPSLRPPRILPALPWSWTKSGSPFFRVGDEELSFRHGQFTLTSNATAVGGKFYFLCACMLAEMDVGRRAPLRWLHLTLQPDHLGHGFFALRGKLLVESLGELLLLDLRIPLWFNVYRTDLATMDWVMLGSLGDKSLFLGEGCCFSLSAAETGDEGGNVYVTEMPKRPASSLEAAVRVQGVA